VRDLFASPHRSPGLRRKIITPKTSPGPKAESATQRIQRERFATHSLDFGIKLRGIAADNNGLDLNPSDSVLKGYFKKAHNPSWNSKHKELAVVENYNHLPRQKY
jgi:hypothetical protein